MRQYIDKPIEAEIIQQLQDLPRWFVKGVEAALLAPTTVNQQKFTFILHDDHQVEAQKRFAIFASYAPIDLGIAKCHFEIGAGKENFKWNTI